LARAQVVGGDLVVLNKVDLVDEVKLGQVLAWLREIKPSLPVFESSQCLLPMVHQEVDQSQVIQGHIFPGV